MTVQWHWCVARTGIGVKGGSGVVGLLVTEYSLVVVSSLPSLLLF